MHRPGLLEDAELAQQSPVLRAGKLLDQLALPAADDSPVVAVVLGACVVLPQRVHRANFGSSPVLEHILKCRAREALVVPGYEEQVLRTAMQNRQTRMQLPGDKGPNDTEPKLVHGALIRQRCEHQLGTTLLLGIIGRG